MKSLHFYLLLLLLCSFEGISSQSLPDYTNGGTGGSGESGSGESGSGESGSGGKIFSFGLLACFVVVVVVWLVPLFLHLMHRPLF